MLSFQHLISIQKLKYFHHFLLRTKFSKLGVPFILTAHLSIYTVLLLYFSCSADTRGSKANIWDSTGLRCKYFGETLASLSSSFHVVN